MPEDNDEKTAPPTSAWDCIGAARLNHRAHWGVGPAHQCRCHPRLRSLARGEHKALLIAWRWSWHSISQGSRLPWKMRSPPRGWSRPAPSSLARPTSRSGFASSRATRRHDV